MSHCETVNDVETCPSPDRRGEVRRRVLFKGKIVYPHNTLSADCTIRDISPGGARVEVNPEAISADPFLIVVKDAVVHRSQAAWRGDGQVGLKLQDTFSLTGETPLHLRHVQRLWIELMPR